MAATLLVLSTLCFMNKTFIVNQNYFLVASINIPDRSA